MLLEFARNQRELLAKSLRNYDIKEDMVLPDDFVQNLLNNVLERNYMENVSRVPRLYARAEKQQVITWLVVKRLPVPPDQLEEYSLLPRWQSVLSTIHTFGYQLFFVLLRHNGITNLYIGAISLDGLTESGMVADQLIQAITCQMPGIEVEKAGRNVENLYLPMINFGASGAVTGIPFPRKSINYGIFQTLDQLAFGIRDSANNEKDYAVIILARPIPDKEITELIRNLRNIGSEIHTFVQRTEQKGSSENIGQFVNVNVGLGSIIYMLMGGGRPDLMGIGGLLHAGVGGSQIVGCSESVSQQYLDKSMQYCEQLIDKHVDRLKNGRNMGFWNTGIQVLAVEESVVSTVMGMLRSIYSGDESYIEPIRTHLFARNSGASEIIKRFQFIPFPYHSDPRNQQEGWHPFGKIFEGVSTPLNTEELSIATSLPRRDVPGLRFVRNAVRFAVNPPQVKDAGDAVLIGNIMDTGVAVGQEYKFNINSLVKHGLIVGLTGSGKSTTCRKLLEETFSKQIPFLLIEPAKDEYVRWAIEANNELPPKKRIHIFMPGITEYDGHVLEQLKLNPFQPAVAKGGKVNLMVRLDRLKAAIIASLPMADILPVIMEESIYNHVIREMGEKYLFNEFVDNGLEYPLIGDLANTSERIISARGYEKSVRDNLTAAVKTRVNSLVRGWKRDVFNVVRSIDFDYLFGNRVVINLSRIADDKDKSLLMSLLFIALYEYRESKFMSDKKYRNLAGDGKLCHLALIEEAHRLLENVVDYSGLGNPQAVLSKMFSEMLSEIRAYGQGFLIVDQVPSRLIPDAIKNTNMKITHRLVSYDDRKILASCMGLRADQEGLIAVLQPGEAILCSDYDDAATWVEISK